MNKIIEELSAQAVSNFLDTNPKHESLSIGICQEFAGLFLMELFNILAEGDAPLTVKQFQVINKHFKSGIENE